MMKITFPPEILDHIFNFLDNDLSTWYILKACSAIRNPILRGVVNRRLYAHIVVANFRPNRDTPGLFYYSDLFQYLSRNPQVANHIRILEIEIEMPGPSEWYTQLSTILRMLPSALKGISLSSRTWYKPVSWSTLPETFRKAFLDCLCSPNLTDATMQTINGVDCNSLTSDTQFPAQIASVNIDRSHDLPMIISWAKMGHNLRSLTFRSEYEAHYPLLTGLLHSYSDTLIELGLDYALFSDPPTSLPTLSHLPNLTRLTIWVSFLSTYFSCTHSWVDSPIPISAQLVATSPSLKQLILQVETISCHIDLVSKSNIWRSLVPLAEHSSLEHIELMVASGQERNMADTDVISSLMGVPELKRMCEEGFLSMGIVNSRKTHMYYMSGAPLYL